MNSLTSKGRAPKHGPVYSVDSATSLASATSKASSDVTAIHASSSIEAPGQTQPPSPTSTDGWGELENGALNEAHDSDKEGWNDNDPLEEQKPPSLSSIQAAQRRPILPSQAQGLFASDTCDSKLLCATLCSSTHSILRILFGQCLKWMSTF